MLVRLAALALVLLLTACAHQPTTHERDLIAAYCGDAPIFPGETAEAVAYARRHHIDCTRQPAP